MSEQTANEITRDGLTDALTAGKFLGLSRTMIYQLMDSGRLPSVKIGSARRIPWRAIKDFAASLMVAA